MVLVQVLFQSFKCHFSLSWVLFYPNTAVTNTHSILGMSRLEGASVAAWTELLKTHTTAFSNRLVPGSPSVFYCMGTQG